MNINFKEAFLKKKFKPGLLKKNGHTETKKKKLRIRRRIQLKLQQHLHKIWFRCFGGGCCNASKLLWHLENKHTSLKDKPVDYLEKNVNKTVREKC